MIQFPLLTDENFNKKLSEKNEFNLYNSENNLSKILNFNLTSFQLLVKNYLNPNTPYKNLLLYWGTGTGKTYGALTITEQYNSYLKDIHNSGFSIKPYIYIITKSKTAQIQYIKSLINPNFSNYKYISIDDYNNFISLENKFDSEPSEKNYEELNMFIKKLYKQILVPNNNCFYKFLNYKKFFRWYNNQTFKILNEEGQEVIEMDFSNSFFVFDEAHSIENNTAEKILQQIKLDSTNLRIILVSATPINTNLYEAISVFNFLLPIDKQLEFSDYFSSDGIKKKDTIEKLGKISRGYVSYIKSIGYSFPERIDKGKILPSFKFLKLIRCETSNAHQNLVLKTLKELNIDNINQLITIKDFSKLEKLIDFTMPWFSKKKPKMELENVNLFTEEQEVLTGGKKQKSTSVDKFDDSMINKEKFKYLNKEFLI